MLSKKSILALVWLLTALSAAIFPTFTYAQQNGQEKPNFVFVNYLGQELTLDLDDVTYTVPSTAVSPAGGRLELGLAAGEHKYAAHAPGIGLGSSGTFVIGPDGPIGKAARLDKTGPALDRDGLVLEKPRDYVQVFDFDPLAAPAPVAPVVDTWQPTAPAPGQSSLAWTNYNGDELTVDLNGQLYKVPGAVANVPGRLQINVAPGVYRYTASVPYGSLNGEVNVTSGQVVGLTISAKLQPEPKYEIGEPSPLPREVELVLAQEDLTARTIPAGEIAPAEVPSAEGIAPPANGVTEKTVPGLVVKNYSGDTLNFTINGLAYLIPNQAETKLTLPPGQYNYTASLPDVATTGTVEVTKGQPLELSVAINVNHNVLSVYQ